MILRPQLENVAKILMFLLASCVVLAACDIRPNNKMSFRPEDAATTLAQFAATSGIKVDGKGELIFHYLDNIKKPEQEILLILCPTGSACVEFPAPTRRSDSPSDVELDIKIIKKMLKDEAVLGEPKYTENTTWDVGKSAFRGTQLVTTTHKYVVINHYPQARN